MPIIIFSKCLHTGRISGSARFLSAAKAFPFGEGGTAEAVTEEGRQRRQCPLGTTSPAPFGSTLPKGEGMYQNFTLADCWVSQAVRAAKTSARPLPLRATGVSTTRISDPGMFSAAAQSSRIFFSSLPLE